MIDGYRIVISISYFIVIVIRFQLFDSHRIHVIAVLFSLKSYWDEPRRGGADRMHAGNGLSSATHTRRFVLTLNQLCDDFKITEIRYIYSQTHLSIYLKYMHSIYLDFVLGIILCYIINYI